MNLKALCAFSVIAISILGFGCGAEPDDLDAIEGEEESVDYASSALQSSYLGSGSFTRHIYAYDVAPNTTPFVRLTSKDIWGNCVKNEAPMTLVPAWAVNAQICGSLGLSVNYMNGQVNGCYSYSTGSEPVWSYEFSSWNKQLNYNVLAMSGGQIVAETGWMPPTMTNGCPRTFP
jgi:hypothetical protein